MTKMYIIMIGNDYLVGRGDMEKDYWISKENAERKKKIKTKYILSPDKSRALRTNMPDKYIEDLQKQKFQNVEAVPVK